MVLPVEVPPATSTFFRSRIDPTLFFVFPTHNGALALADEVAMLAASFKDLQTIDVVGRFMLDVGCTAAQAATVVNGAKLLSDQTPEIANEH